MKKAGLHMAFASMVIMLALPAVQLFFHIFPEKPLHGAFTLAEKPEFTRENWNNGQVQGQVENYLKDHSGFRNFLIRLQNQIEFSLFGTVNAEGVIVGRERQLFEYDYIRSWLAIDFPGESFVEKKLRRARFVQEYLRREKGIDLVVVFEPGKASFYPEYIPQQYSMEKKGLSTYELYLEKSRELDLDYIDLHHYFLQLKERSEYPLFPRYGTHWSIYGMWYAADSLLNLIREKRGIALPEFTVNPVEVSSRPRETDDDVLKTMNLLFRLPGEKLAYPVFTFDTLYTGEKPMVLTVADSYYWNIFNTRIPKYIFANEAFWYFNSIVYPDHYIKPTFTKDLDLKTEVEKQQVILLMVTERFIYKFDWKFIDQLYDLYAPEWLKDPVYDKINSIMQLDSWYQDMIRKAGEKDISLEEALIAEAKYLYYQDDTLGYMLEYGPEHFKNVIANDTGWMAYIHEKADSLNISVDEMLEADALYIFNQNYPVVYELNRGLAGAAGRLASDPALIERLRKEADSLGCELSFFTRKKAWQLYREEELQKTRLAILNDPAWLGDVRQKALKKGISLEEMIREDAVYLWDLRMKSP